MAHKTKPARTTCQFKTRPHHKKLHHRTISEGSVNLDKANEVLMIVSNAEKQAVLCRCNACRGCSPSFCLTGGLIKSSEAVDSEKRTFAARAPSPVFHRLLEGACRLNMLIVAKGVTPIVLLLSKNCETGRGFPYLNHPAKSRC